MKLSMKSKNLYYMMTPIDKYLNTLTRKFYCIEESEVHYANGIRSSAFANMDLKAPANLHLSELPVSLLFVITSCI